MQLSSYGAYISIYSCLKAVQTGHAQFGAHGKKTALGLITSLLIQTLTKKVV